VDGRNIYWFLHAATGDMAISASEITLGNKVGAGTSGEVYEGDWMGTSVAVKIIATPEDQDLIVQCRHEERIPQ